MKPNLNAVFHGLNKYYYSMNIDYKKNEFEQKMLKNLYKKKWNAGLKVNRFQNHSKNNIKTMKVS